MGNIIATVIYCCIITLSMFYIIHDLLNNPLLDKKKFILSFIIVTVITIIGCLFINKTLKIFILSITFFLYIKIIYRENIQKSVITSIFYQLVVMISELLFSIISVTVLKLDLNLLFSNPVYMVLLNIIISMINILITKIPFVRFIYNYFIKVTDNINTKHLLWLSMISIIIANVLTGILYYKIDYVFLLIFNTLVALFCFGIVLFYFKTENKYIKVTDKYNTTLNSLKEYEDVLDKYKISNHENKNQLLTIRNMVPKNNKKIIDYIDKIVDNKLKDNEKIMFDVSKIPAGGLRGLIYSKILQMNDLDINYFLEISKEIKIIDFIKLDDSLILDVCKVIGVYLDNAIDAVKELNKKSIVIEMYIEKSYLIISISNNFHGTLDIEKIENKGYTSKGKNHGYGLALSKSIIDNNVKLKNEKKINKDIFTQILKIKI